MNNRARFPIPHFGPYVVSNGSTIAFVPVLAGTAAANVVTGSHNQAGTSPAYTFETTLDQYQKIFSGQCDRVHTFIHDQLDNLDSSDEDRNEQIVERIARIIDLIGEPASCTAMLEADLLKDDSSSFEPLVLAIGSSKNSETEFLRADTLRRFAKNSNYRIRKAAVRALGRMKSSAARRALEEISKQQGVGEVAGLAAALLR